jgi:hypothetical protein
VEGYTRPKQILNRGGILERPHYVMYQNKLLEEPEFTEVAKI